METEAETHSRTLDRALESYEEFGEGFRDPEEVRNATGRPTESTKLSPSGFLETEPHGLDPGLHARM